jgi:F0F1-type ATP synthase assembly protein I
MSEKEQQHQRRKANNGIKAYVKYSSIAMQMGVIIFLGVFGGMKIDQWLNLQFPVFLLILSLSGVALAIYVAIKDFIKFK